MSISASNIASSSTLNELRTQFNNLVTDVSAIEGGTISYTTLNTTNTNTTILNVKEDGTIVFEGATDDGFETTLTVVDPTADRTITFPNETGTVHTSGGDTTHTNIIIADAGNIGSASSTSAITIASTGIVTLVDDLILKDAGTIGSASSTGAITIASTGIVTLVDDLILKDAATIGVTSSTSAISIASTGIVTLVDDLILKDAATIGVASSTSAISIASTGIVTFVDDILIKDAGTIGSASDPDAIGISSGGVISVTATTANTSATDGALTVAGGLGVAADVSIGDDLRLISDATVLSFGANSDVTLTHVHDTGLLLNGTSVIQFNDASQSIGAPSNAILDINATDEIELNATLLDVNANINASGTYTGAGLMTTGGNIVIPDAGTIGSATDVDAIAIGSDGDITLTQDLELQHDGAILSFGTNDEVTLTHVHDTGLLLNGTSVIQFNDASQSIGAPSNAILDINATDEIELNATLIDINGNVEISGTTAQVGVLTTTATQVATGGITSGSNIVSDTDSTDDLGTTSVRWANLFVDAITTTGEITATGFTGTLDGILGSGTAAAATTTALASTTITASGIIKTDDATAATSTTDGSLQTDGGLSVVLDAVIGDDLFLLSDAPVIHFGANSEVTLTHVHNVGLELKHTATADDTPIVLTLATGETDMAANDVMGKIQFQAPDEGTGTDAILVAAAIQARSEGDFSSSVNTTSLDFMTGASETAATRMTITSAGNVAIGEASTTARLDVHKTSVVAAEISNATNGHFFTAQSDDNTDAFEIYQQHGSNTTRNTFVVTDNHTGSKGESFLVRGDGRVGIGTSAPDSLVEISSGGGTTAKIATTTSNSLAELILEDGNAGYGLQIRSDNAQSLADGAFVINDRDTGSFPFALFEGAPSQSLAIKADANAFAVYVGYKQAIRLRGVSANSNTGEQQFRIEWWNENEAGIMAKIGCNRTDSSLAPGALVFFTSANVDTTANSGEGNITEHFRIAANGDLTGTDTSIGSNSDSRLKKNIQNYSYSLEDFKKYVPKTFDWHNPEKHGNKSNVRGFIAQEVQEIDSRYIGGIEIKSDNPDYNLLTKTEDDLEDEKTALTSALGSKDAMYISVIQQLAEKIEVLEAKMTALEK